MMPEWFNCLWGFLLLFVYIMVQRIFCRTSVEDDKLVIFFFCFKKRDCWCWSFQPYFINRCFSWMWPKKGDHKYLSNILYVGKCHSSPNPDAWVDHVAIAAHEWMRIIGNFKIHKKTSVMKEQHLKIFFKKKKSKWYKLVSYRHVSAVYIHKYFSLTDHFHNKHVNVQ